jgi:hypothetical protein
MGTWLNNDSLFLKFGTNKADVETAGTYKSYGPTVTHEIYIDLTKLTSSAVIQSDTFRLPGGANWFIEEVVVDVETNAASSGSGTVSVGLIQGDRSTGAVDNAFVNALDLHASNAGTKFTLTLGSTGAGTLIGSHPSLASDSYYITAKEGTAVYQTGVIRVRIMARGIGTIPN